MISLKEGCLSGDPGKALPTGGLVLGIDATNIRGGGGLTHLKELINTLVGQPASYWFHTETNNEANEISRFFLIRGWYAYVFWDIFYFSAIFFLVSILPRRSALICIFIFTLIHFVGTSNWFFYEWRMGMETPVIFGIILSMIIVMLAFPTPNITTTQDLLSNEAAA